MSFLEGWDDIMESLEVHRRTYGGTSVGASALSATGGGGGFRFPDEDAARAMVQRFEDRANAINERQELIGMAERALERGFAADDASNRYTEKAMSSLSALSELNLSARRYAENYAQKIQAAIEAKHSDEGGIVDGVSAVVRRVV